MLIKLLSGFNGDVYEIDVIQACCVVQCIMSAVVLGTSVLELILMG